MGFLRFLWRHPIAAILAALGIAMTIGGLISDAYSFYQLGLPPLMWAAIGAAIFMGSIVWMLYRWEARLPDGSRGTGDASVVLAKAESADQYSGIYEGAHEKLMNFVVEHLLPTCYTRECVHREIIRALCENAPVAELAQMGAVHHPNAYEYSAGQDGLLGLGTSPPQFIPFQQMIESVSRIEKGYQAFRLESDRIAQSGYVHPRSQPRIATLWEEWRVAHNAMVSAYEPIKRDSRMGKLFRPARESRWGGIVAETKGVVPLSLMLRAPESET